MTKKISSILIVILSLTLLLIGCSSDDMTGDNDISKDSIKITGQLEGNYIQNSIKTQGDLEVINNADEIWAFPLKFYDDGDIDISFIEEKKVFPIDETGNFSIDVEELEQYEQYVFVLADSGANIENQIIRFLAVNGGNNNLNSLIVDDLKNDLNLGLMSQKDNELVSERNIVEVSDSFTTISTSELSQMATADNVVKAIKNYYINFYKRDKQYFGNLEYVVDVGDVEFGDYTPKFTLENSTRRFYFKTTSSNGEGVVSPKINGGATLTGPNNEEIKINKNGWMNSSSSVPSTLPSGTWTLKDDTGTTLGSYNFNIITPVDSEGQLIGYIPKFKVNEDDNGKFEGITIEWYLNRGDGKIEKVNNVNTISSVVTGGRLACTTTSGERIGGSITITDEKIIGSEENRIDIDNLDTVVLSYKILGSQFSIKMSHVDSGN